MDPGEIDGGHLHSFVQRYERLQEEIDALNEDRGELMKEVASAGFDKTIFKIVIKRRKMGDDQCDEQDTLVELYERALANNSTDETRGEDASRTRTRTSPDLDRAVRDFVRDVPEDTTVSIATMEGKGFAVTNAGGHRTVRQFGQDEAAPEAS